MKENEDLLERKNQEIENLKRKVAAISKSFSDAMKDYEKMKSAAEYYRAISLESCGRLEEYFNKDF